MELGKQLPVMLGEYWVYALAGVISITTLTLLYSYDGPVVWPRWW
jgi:hypothetical protein